MFENFSEVLLVYATYKSFALRITMDLLLVVDVDGLSEIVASFTLADETIHRIYR